MNEFYMTLTNDDILSNSINLNNNSIEFRTSLCEQINISNYKVGLSNIVISQSWPSIQQTVFKLNVYNINDIIVEKHSKEYLVNAHYYSKIDYLIRDFNIKFNQFFDE